MYDKNTFNSNKALQGELKMKPIMEWIIVKDLEIPDRTEGGIYIPESAKKKESIQRSEVIAISDEIPTEDLSYEVGDIIARHKQTGVEFEKDNEKYLFIKYDGIMGVE